VRISVALSATGDIDACVAKVREDSEEVETDEARDTGAVRLGGRFSLPRAARFPAAAFWADDFRAASFAAATFSPRAFTGFFLGSLEGGKGISKSKKRDVIGEK
jgi:hypothetical protein